MKILEIKDCLACPCRDETPSTVSGPNYVSWCEQAGKEICWWEPKEGEIPDWCQLEEKPGINYSNRNIEFHQKQIKRFTNDPVQKAFHEGAVMALSIDK